MDYFGEQWNANGKNGDSAGRSRGVDEGNVVAAVDREAIDAASLIPLMLEALMAGDQGFRREQEK
ncbi:DUF2274 domain-containing protein [Burkholderia sp. BE17]|uniref:DUF2274 domain-containing protein n=1 Tax=Burkholderia sp. BE17 TaxID=2656644 RepID=UPI00128C96B5|nr:DUF2274 domain-containing protein [Burkholderia sp. BE17]MPV64310.1 DUF2274 domain-containing protein [Burkholderia sp. BE17]